MPGKKEYISVKHPVTGKRRKYQKQIVIMRMKEEAKISTGFGAFVALRQQMYMWMHYENSDMLLYGLTNF